MFSVTLVQTLQIYKGFSHQALTVVLHEDLRAV